MRTRKLRRLWVTAHSWLGLTAGLLFCVMGLSGSFLVFYPEIDRMLNPELVTTTGQGRPVPVARVLASAGAISGGRFVHSMFPAGEDFAVHRVWLTPSASDQSRMWEVLVDPYSAKVLGERPAVPVFDPARRNIVNTIYTLHYNLFAGSVGGTIVGLIGIALLFSLVSGMTLWWPRRGKWRQMLSIKHPARGFRLHVDLHRVTGAYGAILLVTMAVTGICLVFPDQVRALIPGGATLRGVASPKSSAIIIPAPDADAVIAASHAFLPGATVRVLWLPGASGSDWRVTLREPGHVGWAGGAADIAIDPVSGRMVSLARYEGSSAEDKILAWQLPLHNGSALGTLGRVLMCIAGLAPTFLLVTGCLIYWRKRQASRHPLHAAALSTGQGTLRGDRGGQRPTIKGERP